ncbi:hypothetical protein [Fundidesulfovibrio soli]|uniref:hypothetical protein n=1 Tax=Fundidesulfovibrio soli TaxID=2922716 RepID=UPI001FAEAD60|nr:hypothetical protein [Fundidesulfovibrio soli]
MRGFIRWILAQRRLERRKDPFSYKLRLISEWLTILWLMFAIPIWCHKFTGPASERSAPERLVSERSAQRSPSVTTVYTPSPKPAPPPARVPPAGVGRD